MSEVIKTDRGPAVNLAALPLPKPIPRRVLVAKLRAIGVTIKRVPSVGPFVPVVDLLTRCIDVEG